MPVVSWAMASASSIHRRSAIHDQASTAVRGSVRRHPFSGRKHRRQRRPRSGGDVNLNARAGLAPYRGSQRRQRDRRSDRLPHRQDRMRLGAGLERQPQTATPVPALDLQYSCGGLTQPLGVAPSGIPALTSGSASDQHGQALDRSRCPRYIR